MLRRAIGLGLLGLGACLLGAALAVRLFLVPGLVKLPLDQVAHPEGHGSDVSFFDLEKQQQRTGLEADVQQNVQGEPDAPGASGDVAVWNYGSVISDTDGNLLNAGTYRVCLDRHTAEAVAGCESTHVDYDRKAEITGLTLTFPFGTEKRDYDVFNATAGQAFPAKFDGEDTIEGVDVYRFVQTIPETVIRQTEVPGAMAGVPDEDTVMADIVYTNERTMWVEPASGVIVSAEEHLDTVVRGPDGTTGVTMLAGDFAATDKTLAEGVERAKDTRSQITMVKTVLPLLLAGVGLVLVLLGLFLGRRTLRGDDGSQAPVADTQRVPQVQ
jgi:Porin PorA